MTQSHKYVDPQRLTKKINLPTTDFDIIDRGMGRGCSSVVRASDRHAAEAGSIPRYGKGFFS